MATMSKKEYKHEALKGIVAKAAKKGNKSKFQELKDKMMAGKEKKDDK